MQEVEKYPCVYNYRLPEYARRDATERAWNAIGKVFNLTGKLNYFLDFWRICPNYCLDLDFDNKTAKKYVFCDVLS